MPTAAEDHISKGFCVKRNPQMSQTDAVIALAMRQLSDQQLKACLPGHGSGDCS
jgi:hypothetical protein